LLTAMMKLEIMAPYTWIFSILADFFDMISARDAILESHKYFTAGPLNIRMPLYWW
jgi:hypothetical protein